MTYRLVRARTTLAFTGIVLGLSSLALVAGDLLTDFKQTRPVAEDAVLQAVWNGGAPYLSGTWSIFKSLSPEARAAAISSGAEFAKAYVNSDAFKKQYAAMRQREAPTAPEAPKPWAEQRAAQNAEFEKSMQQMKENIPKMPPDMQKTMQETMASIKAQHDAQDKDADYQAMMEKSVTMGYDAQKQNYARDLKKFYDEHPEDPNLLVAARLKQFLADTADVPAQAELVSQAGAHSRFADPKYERKNDFWKRCFRAGKPALDAARAAAEGWLASIH